MIKAKVFDLGYRLQIQMSKNDFDKVKANFEFVETLHYLDKHLVLVTDERGDVPEYVEHIAQILSDKSEPHVYFEGFTPDKTQLTLRG